MRNIYRGAAVSIGAIVATGAIVTPAHAAATPTFHPLSAAATQALFSGASAQASTQWYVVKNLATGKYLSVSGGSTANDAPIVQSPLVSHLQAQAWTFTYEGSAWVFRSATSTNWKAISISKGSKLRGAPAIQYTYEPGVLNEEWLEGPADEGVAGVKFKNANSGMDLEIPGSNPDSGTAVDQWTDVYNAHNEVWTLGYWS